MIHDTRRNTQTAKDFYDLMFNRNQPRAAVEQYVGEDYIQHNPDVGDGKEEFVTYFERMTREWPGKRMEVKRAVAEADKVVLHCYQHWPNPDGDDLEYAGIDIFRFDDAGKVVEHWDVLQLLPSESKNDNGMF